MNEMLLIDTDAISHLVRGKDRGQLVSKLASVAPDDRYISAVTLAELLYGLEKKKPAPRLKRQLQSIIKRVVVVPFDGAAAREYARIRARVEQSGKPLSHPDLQIAAIAMARGFRLLTGNVRHFGRIEGLEVEGF